MFICFASNFINVSVPTKLFREKYFSQIFFIIYIYIDFLNGNIYFQYLPSLVLSKILDQIFIFTIQHLYLFIVLI